jgi:copper transporter 1
MFASCCIGLAGLVLLLDFFRRMTREYDRYLMRWNTTQGHSQSPSSAFDSKSLLQLDSASKGNPAGNRLAEKPANLEPFRPSILQQSVRAGLHMLQSGIAYIIMLLAMYYNGFFITSIFLSAFIGSFILKWETLGMRP